jgi:glutamyl-tRNA synthetase
MLTTRLAPSPTGALHLGNARTFLINWLLGRKLGWRIVLRIEDLDGPRVKPGADATLLEDLRWLGLDYDGPPARQSTRVGIYQKAVEKLLDDGVAYPCICTRKEVELAASAPHAEDGSAVYPGTCRGEFATLQEARRAAGREPAIRFAAPDRENCFEDEFAGPRRFNVARELGDFVIQKADGTAAYQLAVVVDDLDAGVTHIVRGDDLLDSTPRQILIYEALGAGGDIPRYTHVPLVIGEDGRRLAKRHGDTRLSTYRETGIPASRVLTLLARWCGLERDRVKHPSELVADFRLDRIPPHPIVFSAADEAFLRQTSG